MQRKCIVCCQCHCLPAMCSLSVDKDNKTCKTVKLHLFIYFDKTLMQVGIEMYSWGMALAAVGTSNSPSVQSTSGFWQAARAN